MSKKKKLITRVCFVTEMPAKKCDDITEEWIMKGTLNLKELRHIVNNKNTKVVTVTIDWGLV